jgi:peroxiredoxin
MEEVPSLNELYDTYKGKNIEILAINSGESKEDVKQVIKDNGIKYRVLLDTEDEISGLYNLKYFPTNVLVGMNGKVIYSEPGELPSEDVINKALKK